MATALIPPPPPGFQIDAAPTAGLVPPPPPGFKVDAPQEDAPKEKSLLRRAAEVYYGPTETGLSLATGMVAPIIGSGVGIVKGLFGGKYGTAEGAREAAETASSVAQALTYKPRGEVAQDALAGIGKVFEASKLGGLGPSEAMMIGNSGVRQAVAGTTAKVDNAVSGVTGKIKNAVSPEAEMIGVGSAAAGDEALRRGRAADLKVPVQLTKGQATRDFEQQRFERETAKEAKTGAPLRDRYAKQNEDIIKNFEAWVDETGAQAPDAVGVGKVVDKALRSKMDLAKAEINAAYTVARDAGHMAEPIDTSRLVRWIEENRSAEKIAPVIAAVESELVRLGGAKKLPNGSLAPGQIPINDLENARKLIGRLGRADETNGHFAGLANQIIDQMTEGKGGALYQDARNLFKGYDAEFKKQGAVRKLVGTKPGTNDRSVALEDVFQHSILSGSAQDTENIFKALSTAPGGQQAIAELKGATMNYLKEQATKNSARDVRGNPILSYPQLLKAVKGLDQDGKLDMIFGKKGAEQIRDITELVADVHTAPPGVINTSNTASVLLEALGAASTGRMPTASAKVVGVLKEAVGNRVTNRRVRDALANPEEAPIQVPPPPNKTLH